VILEHAIQAHVPPLLDIVLSRLANFGVCIFFVISGYLITTLLLREAESKGTVSLRRFYLRRTLRIFPPYYSYLLVVLAGVYLGNWSLPPDARLWPAFIYATNFIATHNWLTLHSWSLSLEEQFYITWPVVLTLLIKRHGVPFGIRASFRAAIIALLILPLARIIAFALTRDGAFVGGMIFDYVAAGSAIALLAGFTDSSRIRSAIERLLRSKWTPLTAAVAIALHLAFQGTMRWRFAIGVVIATPIEAVLLAIFVAWAVANARHPIGRLLNLRLLRVIGVGSYSLYLWQQLFLGQESPFTSSWNIAARLGATVVCAAASYFLIERPSLRARARIEQRLSGTTAT
jgi:peptidoglycan/LPS O-acetylase OafA/YrhL